MPHSNAASPRPGGRHSSPRVVVLSNYPVDHVTFNGGVETATAALLEGLREYRTEFDFHVVSVSNVLVRDAHETYAGIHFHFLGGLYRQWLRPRLPLRVAKVCAALRALRPKLVHCQGNPDLALAALLAGYRPILTIHGVPRDEAHLRTGWEFWSAQTQALLARLVSPHIGAHICNSTYVANTLTRTQARFAVPNAVASLFLDAAARRVAPAQPPYLLFLGVLAPLKRPSDLLRAYATLRHQFPNLKLVMCGPTEDEAYAASLRQMAADLNLKDVTFSGPLDQPQVVALLKGATAVVLPSAQENAPMAIAEAMAIGVPVVATRVGGVPEMIEHDHTGLLFEPGDVPGLTHCLERLLLDPALGERLAATARQCALVRYSPRSVGEQTAAIYRTLLAADLAGRRD